MHPTDVLMQTGRDVARFLGSAPGGYFRIDEHGWIALTGEQAMADFNMCFLARTAPASAAEQYANEITERELPAVMIVDEDADHVVEAAVAAGWTNVTNVPVMAWQDGPAPRESGSYDVRIARADEHEAIAKLIAEAFGFDEAAILRVAAGGMFADVEAWAAEEDGELVGTVTLVPSQGHVGVYSMAVPERSQRRGIGRAVLETAMARHVAEGATTFTLEATPAGFHLYEQLGFRTIAEPPALVMGVSAQFPG